MNGFTAAAAAFAARKHFLMNLSAFPLSFLLISTMFANA